MKPRLDVGGQMNRLKQLWRDGRCALGAVATIPSVQTVQVMARAGLDWILIDMEHGPIDANAAHAMIAATAGTPLVPIVRVPSTAAWHAKVPLDSGAMGIVFPMMTRREDAEVAVSAVRYPPDGERGWGPFYAPLRWDVPMREYLDRANDEILAIGIVEHIDAVSNVAEIVSTPGLDMVIIGSGDLAMSMGLGGRADDPAALEAIRRLESAIEPSPILLGGVAQTADQANAMIGRGYNALLVGFDWTLLQRGIASAISEIRAAG